MNVRKLTERRRAVLVGVVAGKSNREIAEGLGCSPETVKYHVRCLLASCGVENRVRLAVVAAKSLKNTN